MWNKFIWLVAELIEFLLLLFALWVLYKFGVSKSLVDLSFYELMGFLIATRIIMIARWASGWFEERYKDNWG